MRPRPRWRRRRTSERLLVLSLSLAAPAAARAEFPLPPAATGAVYVSSFGTDEIVAYAADGSFIRRFGHPDLRGPRGLAFVGEDERQLLFCAAQSSDRVLVFTPDGVYVRQFTGGGLDGPTGLAIGPRGELHVSSFDTDRVLVFDAAGELEGSYGHADLDGPNCVAFTPDGNRIFVVSQLNSRIVVFDCDRHFLGSFTGGGLASAMGAAVWGGELFVTGGSSHTVAVFDLAGTFRRNIVDELIDGPQGIAFDERGEFVVGSFYTGKVARFTRAGERLDVFDEAGVRVARSIALQPLAGGGVRFIRGDANRDGKVDISDAVARLNCNWLFLGPGPCHGCDAAADANGDGRVNIADAQYLLNFLFLGGPPPPPPFPAPGRDLNACGLGCS
jgi:DNA-binding beta-propeller fold protein YncE